MTVPKVSIGMPVYNGEAFIREALDSLLAQTFTDFELIISDNASTDGTEAICREYAAKDARIRYVRQAENRGALVNFEFVLDAARSDLFMWAAYDDLWAADFLMDATTLLQEKDIDFVFPTFELRSIKLGMAKRNKNRSFGFISSSDRRWRVLNFLSVHFMSHSANIVYSLFRKKIIKKCCKIQDISNDGVLGAVIVGQGRGALSNSLFSKRYRFAWPGMLPSIDFSIFKSRDCNRDRIERTLMAIQAGREKLLGIFPEYGREINYIYDRYQPHKFDRFYRVCSIDKFFRIDFDMSSINFAKVSIGMPVYNGEAFIREALDSLLAQTFTDFELIISDNASTDGTEAICREYAAKDTRIRYVRQAENRGATANFRFVLDEAVGEYFMWAAADDVWSDNWIEVLLPLSVEHQCLAYGTVISIDERGEEIFNPASGRSFEFSGNKLLRRTKYFFAKPSHGKANPIYGLLPREKLENARFRILEDTHSGSDMLFLFDLLRFIEIKRPKEVVKLNKRIHAGCAAPPNNSGAGNKQNFLKAISIAFGSISEPFIAFSVFSKYAEPLEMFVFVLAIVPMSLRNLFVNYKIAFSRLFRKYTFARH